MYTITVLKTNVFVLKLFLVLILISFEIPCFAETTLPTVMWTRIIDTTARDYLSDIVTDEQGGIYVTGFTKGNWEGSNAGYADPILGKYDLGGNLIWKRQFGTLSSEAGYGVALNGSDIITSGQQGVSYYISKTSSQGNMQWRNSWDTGIQDDVSDVAVGIDGSIFTCGKMYSPGGGATIIKHDSNGYPLWRKSIEPSGFGNDLAIDRDGNIFMTGIASAGAWKYNCFVSKHAPNGDLLWEKKLTNPNGDGGYAIAISPSGSIYIAGRETVGTPEQNNADAIVCKYDSDGNLKWKINIGTRLYDTANGIVVDHNEDIYITGKTLGVLGEINYGSYDIFVSKLDPIGDIQWTMQFGTPLEDEGEALSVDKMGHLFIAGNYLPTSNNGDGIIIALSIPEPSTFAMLLSIAVGGLIWWKRRNA